MDYLLEVTAEVFELLFAIFLWNCLWVTFPPENQEVKLNYVCLLNETSWNEIEPTHKDSNQLKVNNENEEKNETLTKLLKWFPPNTCSC